MLKSVGNFSIRSGDQTIIGGNLIIGTAGKGIDFSADPSAAGMTSELLDDYEEGTWTATLHDSGTAGNASATTITGYYTKIGRIVNATLGGWNNIDTTGMTAGSSLFFSLPFTPSAVNGSCGSCILDTFTFPAGTTCANINISPGSTRAQIIGSGTGVADTSFKVSDITTGVSDINRVQITYSV